jgi:hypothetical protein
MMNLHFQERKPHPEDASVVELHSCEVETICCRVSVCIEGEMESQDTMEKERKKPELVICPQP